MREPNLREPPLCIGLCGHYLYKTILTHVRKQCINWSIWNYCGQLEDQLLLDSLCVSTKLIINCSSSFLLHVKNSIKLCMMPLWPYWYHTRDIFHGRYRCIFSWRTSSDQHIYCIGMWFLLFINRFGVFLLRQTYRGIVIVIRILATIINTECFKGRWIRVNWRGKYVSHKRVMLFVTKGLTIFL